MCLDDNFIKPFKSYLDEDVVNNIIDIMVEERKDCSDLMIKYFKKEIAMTKQMLNVGFAIILMLIAISKYGIIAISLENIEALHIVTVTSRFC